MNDNSKKILYVHPKPKKLHKLEDVSSTLQWWTHPETVDWIGYHKSEGKRWLALNNDRKQLERFEEQMASGERLTAKQRRLYDEIEARVYGL